MYKSISPSRPDLTSSLFLHCRLLGVVWCKLKFHHQTRVKRMRSMRIHPHLKLYPWISPFYTGSALYVHPKPTTMQMQWVPMYLLLYEKTSLSTLYIFHAPVFPLFALRNKTVQVLFSLLSRGALTFSASTLFLTATYCKIIMVYKQDFVPVWSSVLGDGVPARVACPFHLDGKLANIVMSNLYTKE